MKSEKSRYHWVVSSAYIYAVILVLAFLFWRASILRFVGGGRVTALFVLIFGAATTLLVWSRHRNVPGARAWLYLKILGNTVFYVSIVAGALLEIDAFLFGIPVAILLWVFASRRLSAFMISADAADSSHH